MATATSEFVPRGTETILLVEPDPEFRTLAAFMLSRLGYCVLEAHNAMEALQIYDQRGCGVDLLLTAARMRRADGNELAQSLSARDAGMRVLFLADADGERTARRAGAPKHSPLLARPFTLAALANGVRKALDHPARRPKVLSAV